jgi:hypothetical protein
MAVGRNTLFHLRLNLYLAIMNSEKPLFKSGFRYLVLMNVSELGHAFSAGEIVVFSCSSYDAYHGVTRYWFKKSGSMESNAWHVWDNAPSEAVDSRDVFAPV